MALCKSARYATRPLDRITIKGSPQNLHSALFLLFLALIAPVQNVHSEDSYARADAELTVTYKQALAALNPGPQELLRKAERAWITFSDKDEALLKALRSKGILAQDALETAKVSEVRARNRHLQNFFVRIARLTGNPQAEWQIQDQQLEKVYAEYRNRLGKGDQILLRDAERAWIVYRDLDGVAANAMADLAPGIAAAAKADLTAIRVAQLRALLMSPVAQFVPRNTPVATNAPSPEDQKAVGKLKEEAQVLLKTFVEKKDSPFFAKADAIKNVPELSSSLAEQVAAIDTRFTELGRRGDLSKLLEPASNEMAAIGLLGAWPQFTRQLKAGSIDEAGAGIERALRRTPKAPNSDYLPLWTSAESWRGVLTKNAAEYQAHVNKARSLAALGKNSDAIREYEAAFAIVEAASITAEIKKLREQSLGL